MVMLLHLPTTGTLLCLNIQNQEQQRIFRIFSRRGVVSTTFFFLERLVERKKKKIRRQ